MASAVFDDNRFVPVEVDLSETPITVHPDGPCKLRGVFVHTASATDVELKDGTVVKWTIPAGVTGAIPLFDVRFENLVIDGGTSGNWNLAVERLNP